MTDGDELSGVRPCRAHEDLASALGYFALVCKIRYFIVTGEFEPALELLGLLQPRGAHPIFNKVVPCYVSLFYHAGYAFLMTHNYVEALRCFSNVLLYASRARSFCARSYQYDQLTKCQEQSLALLMVAYALCPWKGLDTQVFQMTQEHRHLPSFKKLQSGNLATFEEKLRFGSPKFLVSSHELLLEKNAALPEQLAATTLHAFLAHIQDQREISRLFQFLQSYRELSFEKLGKLMGAPAEEARRLVLKLKERFRQQVAGEGGFKLERTENFEEPVLEVGKQGVVIAASKRPRAFKAGFERAIFKLKEMQNKLL